ncbi:MAG: hypothetical protein IT464_12100 [Planctomycetes bacterium]|nr:hypothetical protein [Planctomycetota bacterium]
MKTGTDIKKLLKDFEQAIEEIVATDGGGLEGVLQRIYAASGQKLLRLGFALVFVDAKPFAVPKHANPDYILGLVGKERPKYCVFELDPCTGALTAFEHDPGRPIRGGTQFSVSVCNVKPDGLLEDRQIALQEDAFTGEALRATVEIVKLEDGRELLTFTFPARDPIPSVTLGAAIPADYPRVGVDWVFVRANVDVEGFKGQRKQARATTGVVFHELSFHPACGKAMAAAFLIAVYRETGSRFRSVN